MLVIKYSKGKEIWIVGRVIWFGGDGKREKNGIWWNLAWHQNCFSNTQQSSFLAFVSNVVKPTMCLSENSIEKWKTLKNTVQRNTSWYTTTTTISVKEQKLHRTNKINVLVDLNRKDIKFKRKTVGVLKEKGFSNFEFCFKNIFLEKKINFFVPSNRALKQIFAFLVISQKSRKT